MKILKRLHNRISSYNLYWKNKEILDRNKKLKNTKLGQRCFIIGNGPSIKNQDLIKLKNEETFVVNTFWNHPDYYEINPKYYVLIDTDVFPQSGKSELLGSSFRREMEEKIQLLESRPTKFFFPINGKSFVERNQFLRNNKVFYLLFSGYFRENLKFNIDLDKILPNPKNVIVSAIEVAAYMGFGEMYLLGCEHSYLAHPHHYEDFEHFYENKKYDLNNPETVERYALVKTTYEGYIKNTGVLFRNYRLLKAKLEKERLDVKIYNATPNSFLDVFPPVKFEDIKL